MAEGLPRFCIFGDSHYACLKQAEVQGLVDVSGVELEYWGHVGGRFLYLRVQDGAIYPKDDFTAMRFAKFNAKGRTFLPAADFDAILVMGARVYIWRLFQRVLTLLSSGPLVSEGLVRRILTDDLRRHIGYQLARGLAESGTARILLAPTAWAKIVPFLDPVLVLLACATVVPMKCGTVPAPGEPNAGLLAGSLAQRANSAQLCACVCGPVASA